MVSRQAAKTWEIEAQQERSRRTQERILRAAEQLLAKRPYREISLIEIVRKARASTSAIYQRFGDKTSLLGCLFERHAQTQKQLLDELLAVARWRDVPLSKVVREIAPIWLDAYRQNQGMIRAFIEQASTDERFHRTWNTLGTYTSDRIKNIVRSHLSEVAHPDPMAGVDEVMDLVYGNVVYEVMMHQIDRPKMTAKTEHLIQMIFSYLGIQDD